MVFFLPFSYLLLTISALRSTVCNSLNFLSSRNSFHSIPVGRFQCGTECKCRARRPIITITQRRSAMNATFLPKAEWSTSSRAMGHKTLSNRRLRIWQLRCAKAAQKKRSCVLYYIVYCLQFLLIPIVRYRWVDRFLIENFQRLQQYNILLLASRPHIPALLHLSCPGKQWNSAILQLLLLLLLKKNLILAFSRS